MALFDTPEASPNAITYFAETDSRGKKVRFGIKDEDRTRHMYVIGQTGMGKSVLLENMAVQDIQNGNGLCFIDPHGAAIDTLIDYIPKDRIEDVVYFAPFDLEHPISFNVMEDVGPDKRHLVAQGLLSAFKKIWGEETFSARMEHIINNTLLALLEYPDTTILSMTRMLTERAYRDRVVESLKEPSVKAFWINEFGSWDERYQKEAAAGVLNKVSQFVSNPLIRNIVGQPKSSFDFRDAMDKKKIVLVNLSKGQVGEENSKLLGAMITTKVYLAAMSRADVSKQVMKTLPYFYLYVDEFQTVVNDSFESILSEARKYRLSLIIAHQYIEQMPEIVRAAVFGNVGTRINFRVGAADAEFLEKGFGEKFLSQDIVSLSRFQVYLILMIDGVGSQPFSARTIPPIELPAISYRDQIIDSSRTLYAGNRAQIEEDIVAWMFDSSDETKKKREKNRRKKQNKKQREWEERKGGGMSKSKVQPQDPRTVSTADKDTAGDDLPLPGTDNFKDAFKQAAVDVQQQPDQSSIPETKQPDQPIVQKQDQQKTQLRIQKTAPDISVLEKDIISKQETAATGGRFAFKDPEEYVIPESPVPSESVIEEIEIQEPVVAPESKPKRSERMQPRQAVQQTRTNKKTRPATANKSGKKVQKKSDKSRQEKKPLKDNKELSDLLKNLSRNK